MTDAHLDFDLGEMADTIREATRRFTADKITPIAAKIDESDEFPRELWPQMGELGLHGITVEEQWGGLGRGYLDLERKRRQQPISNSDPATITTTTPARRTIRSSLNRSRPARTATITDITPPDMAAAEPRPSFLPSRVMGVASDAARPTGSVLQSARVDGSLSDYPSSLFVADTITSHCAIGTIRLWL